MEVTDGGNRRPNAGGKGRAQGSKGAEGLPGNEGTPTDEREIAGVGGPGTANQTGNDTVNRKPAGRYRGQTRRDGKPGGSSAGNSAGTGAGNSTGTGTAGTKTRKPTKGEPVPQLDLGAEQPSVFGDVFGANVEDEPKPKKERATAPKSIPKEDIANILSAVFACYGMTRPHPMLQQAWLVPPEDFLPCAEHAAKCLKRVDPKYIKLAEKYTDPALALIALYQVGANCVANEKRIIEFVREQQAGGSEQSTESAPTDRTTNSNGAARADRPADPHRAHLPGWAT